MARRPAALVGLSGRKGAIAPGRDADLVVVRPRGRVRRRRRGPAPPPPGHPLRRADARRPGRWRPISGAAGSPRRRPARRASHWRGRRPSADGARPAQRAGPTTRPSPSCSAAAARPDGPSGWRRSGRSPPRRRCSTPPTRSGGGSTDADWLEAFAAHPRIGDLDALRAKFAATAAWAVRRAGGRRRRADEATLRALADGNRDYEARFGYIFIVCATGKTAGEMLALLRERLGNDPEAELAVAAAEQAKITRIRLRKLCP